MMYCVIIVKLRSVSINFALCVFTYETFAKKCIFSYYMYFSFVTMTFPQECIILEGYMLILVYFESIGFAIGLFKLHSFHKISVCSSDFFPECIILEGYMLKSGIL